jgi:hypothetical protein
LWEKSFAVICQSPINNVLIQRERSVDSFPCFVFVQHVAVVIGRRRKNERQIFKLALESITTLLSCGIWSDCVAHFYSLQDKLVSLSPASIHTPLFCILNPWTQRAFQQKSIYSLEYLLQPTPHLPFTSFAN